MNHLIKRIKKYLKMYTYFWKVAFNLATMYRVDTLMLTLSVILLIAVYSLFFGLVFRSIPVISGWTFYEVLFVLGVYDFNFGLFKVFFGRTMEDAIDKIFDGQYDFYLLKPINERFLAYFLPPLFKAIPATFLGLGVMIYASNLLHLQWNLVTVDLFITYSLISQVTSLAFFQIAISTAFFTGRSDEIFAIFENAWFFSRYPRDIFSGKVLFFLTYIVPITLYASYPAAIILGKIEPTIMGLLLPLLVCIVFTVTSNKFYKFGVKHYSSASS